ncbi:MAG: hypothetical protein ACLUGY_08475 [Phocaeicola massiliensis]
MASKEANKLKYQYNKKYVEAYWERKAQKANGSTTETRKKKIRQTTVTCLDDDYGDDELEMEDRPVTVSRKGKTMERYIKCLETANRTLSSENARLVRKVLEYHDLLDQITSICSSDENK